jgi:hypothetical protein
MMESTIRFAIETTIIDKNQVNNFFLIKITLYIKNLILTLVL